MSIFAADSLHDVIHGRSRLAILAYLTTVVDADFVTLRDKVAISDGNLSQHLKKLSDAGFVALHKSMIASRTRTVAELTADGRQAFYDYIAQLQALLAVVPKRDDIFET